MTNKPGYHLFKNAHYALEGLWQALKNETSFKIEVVLFIIFSTLFWLLPISLLSKVMLQCSLFIPLIVELLNSAVEAVVDLCTKERHPLAKYAKDAAAAAVLLSLFLTLSIWIAVGIYEFF